MAKLSKSKQTGKHLLERKITNSIGKPATVANKIQYSPNHVNMYAGCKGKITKFDLGSGEADDMIVEIEIPRIAEKGAKKKKDAELTSDIVWVHALDVLELIS